MLGKIDVMFYAPTIALGSLSIGAIVGVGMVIAKSQDQHARDHERQTYRLSFPSDLAPEQIQAWIDILSGTLKPRMLQFRGWPSIVFETIAEPGLTIHRLRVPWPYKDFVVQQLRAHTGVVVTPETKIERYKWTEAVELKIRGSARPMRIKDEKILSTAILNSFQLTKGERVLIQWVVRTTPPLEGPQEGTPSDRFKVRHLVTGNEADADELKARQQKLDEPNVLGVLRVAALASQPARAKHLVENVRRTLASIGTAHTAFEHRMVPTTTPLQERIDRATTPIFQTSRLMLSELVALIAWPMEDHIPGIPKYRGKQFPPEEGAPSEGIVVGNASFPGMERPIAIGYPEALMHTWCLGVTGTGKSVLLAHMARQMMESGHGLIVMETEGNLYNSVLDYVPKDRIDDVILMDVSDKLYPVAFNLLDQGNGDEVIDRLIELFAHQYGGGIRTDGFILHGMQTLMQHGNPKLTLMDLAPLLGPTADQAEWADEIIRAVRDSELRRWWQQQTNRSRDEQFRRAEPLLDRIAQIASRPELKFILGQSKSTIKMRDVLRDNKILLINLKGLPSATASMAGTFIMDEIWQRIKEVSSAKTKPTFLILDEFADFMDLPIDTENMLAQARKHKLGMVLANQHMSQLKGTVREGVISNARSKILLQGNASDARQLIHELHGSIDPPDITGLQAYQGIASILTPSGSTGPMSVNTMPPANITRVAAKVKQRSRERYARPLDEVKADFEKRYTITSPTTSRRRRPTFRDSNDPWGIPKGD